LQRPLLANTLQQPELGGADPPRDGAVEERKRLSSIKRSGPLPRFPCAVSFLSRLPVHRSLAFPRAVPSILGVRYCLALPCTAPLHRCLVRAPLPRFDAVRCLAPESCPSAARCAAPSLRHRAFPRSGISSVHRSLAPVRCFLAPMP